MLPRTVPHLCSSHDRTPEILYGSKELLHTTSSKGLTWQHGIRAWRCTRLRQAQPCGLPSKDAGGVNIRVEALAVREVFRLHGSRHLSIWGLGGRHGRQRRRNCLNSSQAALSHVCRGAQKRIEGSVKALAAIVLLCVCDSRRLDSCLRKKALAAAVL